MKREAGRRKGVSALWMAGALAGVFLFDACSASRRDAAEVTSPIAPYVDEETLDTVSREEVAAAVGAGELSDADAERVDALGDVAQSWATTSEPIWTALLDPNVPYEEFVPLLDSARDDLTAIADEFTAGVESIDDAGLADAFRPFAVSLQDQLAGFEELARAVTSGDATAVAAAEQQLNDVLAEGREAQDTLFTGMRAYLDEEAYCASLPEGGQELPQLCGTPPTTSA